MNDEEFDKYLERILEARFLQYRLRDAEVRKILEEIEKETRYKVAREMLKEFER